MYLQLNTQFNPFTFEEMVKPLLLYKQAYDTTEAQYADLQAQTEQWKQAAENDSSPLVRSMYNDYAQRLNNTLADFSRGMTASNRAASMSLKRDFAQNIKPIEVAFKRRSALEDEQRKARLANDSLIFERNAGDMSLEEFIKNPNAGYGDVINGNVIRAASAQAYKNLAKRIRKGDNELKQIFRFTYEQTKKYGLTEDEILQVLKNDPNANEAAIMIRDTIRNTTNINQWGNEVASKKVDAFINEGMWNALGTEQSNIINDNYGMQSALSAQSYNQQVALENLRYQHDIDRAGLQGDGQNNPNKISQIQTHDQVRTISKSGKDEIAKNKEKIEKLQSIRQPLVETKRVIDSYGDVVVENQYGKLQINPKGSNLPADEINKLQKLLFKYNSYAENVQNYLKRNVSGDGTNWFTMIGTKDIIPALDNAVNILSNKVRTNYKVQYYYPVNVSNPEKITKKLISNIGDLTGEALVSEKGEKIDSKEFGNYLNDATTYILDDKGIKVVTNTEKNGESVTNSAYLDLSFLGVSEDEFRQNLARMNEANNLIHFDLDGNQSFTLDDGREISITDAKKAGKKTPVDIAKTYLAKNANILINMAQASNTLNNNKLESGVGVETTEENF